MIDTKVIILADGQSEPGHLANRHMEEIGGEPLLLRTIRQFREHTKNIVVICPDELGDQLPVSSETAEDRSHAFFGVDMVRKGLNHLTEHRSLIVFGDVWFTDEAIQTIWEGGGQEWSVFGRSHDGGKRWGEPFAIEVSHHSLHDPMMKAVEAAANHYMADHWPRCSFWEWYFEMEKMPYRIENFYDVKVGPHWVEINDETDDVDYWADLDRLRKMVA